MMKRIKVLVGNRSGGNGNTGQINSSSEQCLLCGNNGASNRRFAVANNDDDDVHSGNNNNVALKMLTRYLKIDVSKVLSNSVDGAAASHQNDEVKLEEILTRTLCEPCDSSVVKFWEVYQNFEVIRLQLEQSLHGIREHLETFMTEEDDNSMSVKDGTLRREVLRKCILKLASSSPRVRMENIGNNYKTENNASTSGTSKIFVPEANQHHDELDESVPIVKQEESDTGTTNYSDDDDGDDDDYTPASPDSSFSDASSSTSLSLLRESDSEKPKTTVVADREKTSIPSCEPTPSPTTTTVKLTSCRKLNRLGVANLIRVKPCRICGKYFPTKTALHLHMPVHSNPTTATTTGLSIKCSYCPQVSNDLVEHQQHVLCSHPIEFMGNGDLLPAGTTKQKLNLVLTQMLNQCDRVLLNENECFRCSICDSAFTDTLAWRVHVLEAHLSNIVTRLNNNNNNNNPSEIEIETNHTTAERELQSTTSTRGVTCLHCGKYSKQARYHRAHMKQVHPFEYYNHLIPAGVNINEQDFMKCLSSVCKQIVKKTVINSQKTQVQCPFCPTSFSEYISCRWHICEKHMNKLTDLEEPLPCGNKSPPSPKRSHPKSRPSSSSKKRRRAKCDYCGKEFQSPVACREHKITHHCFSYLSNEVGVGHQLPSHATEINLERAMEAIMDEAKADKDTSRTRVHYQCPLCKEPNLFRYCKLRHHLLSATHLDEVLPRLVQKIADLTKSRDSSSSALERHNNTSPAAGTTSLSAIKIVPDVDPVTCAHCGVLTASKHSYRTHLKRRHSYYYYIKKLRGVAEKDFNRTLEGMISECKLKNNLATSSSSSSSGMVYKCILCKKYMCSIKQVIQLHLLSNAHFPQVLSRLRRNKGGTASSGGESGESDSEIMSGRRSDGRGEEEEEDDVDVKKISVKVEANNADGDDDDEGGGGGVDDEMDASSSDNESFIFQEHANVGEEMFD